MSDKFIIALDGLDFTWRPGEVDRVKHLWGQGLHIADISREVKRDADEVAILIMHLARHGEIRRRENGCYGKDDGKHAMRLIRPRPS